MIVQACLNGARPLGFHPRLPVTASAIAADGAAAVRAGAAELHVHARDGAETLAPATVDAVVGELRRAMPGTLVGISSGEWIEKDDDRRLAYIDAWRELPDYASVNFSERDASAVCERLVRRGVQVEAGLMDLASTERFIALGLAPLCLRLLIEIMEPDEAAAHALTDRILARLAAAGIRKPVLIHGANDTVWSFVERAARQGYSTRVGLEDGATLPDGRVAGSNAEIVAAAVAMMRQRMQGAG
jgi:uncharacterized protein (DUF849 family)